MSDCCASNKNIKNACEGNRKTSQDILTFYVACISDVASVPAAVNHIVSGNIEMLDDATFFKWDVDPTGSTYTSDTQGEGEAQEFITTGVARITGMAADVHNALTGRIRGRSFVIIRDKNGLYHLIGAVDDGALVKVQAGTRPNGYNVTFTWTSADLPLLYTGAISVAADA